ncbi:MAG: MoxR family ATPase [Thermodesulfovibrionia bacterium]|nr:MoxR family ATPase [Thermodesulfovibrionia bacterium]
MDTKIQKFNEILQSLLLHLHGKEKALRLSLITFFSQGHLLIEDLPGLGKTTLAVSIANAFGLKFGRIQCTNDLLPSDITGVSIYNKNTDSFEFHPGPIFNNIVLVDEINRATSKTQSALLEAMQERQITVEGVTYKLEQPFFVIATQNPVEHHGTFPLPKSQLDRFMMQINIGYPDKDSEKRIIKEVMSSEAAALTERLIDKDEVISIQKSIRDSVYISDNVLAYILDVVKATRNSKYFLTGLSTRGALAITETARTNAFFSGRDFLIPEDVKEMAEFTIPHRVIFKDEYESYDKKEIIRSIVKEVPVPV